MLHPTVSPHSRRCTVTIVRDTLQRQLSIVVAAFCLANEQKAGAGLKTWSFSLNLVRFIACLQIVCIRKVDSPFLCSMKLPRAKLRHPAACRHWQNRTLGHQSHCPGRILSLECVRLGRALPSLAQLGVCQVLTLLHRLRRSCRMVVLCST